MLILGTAALLFFGGALIVYRSPFGLDHDLRWGLLAGAGWLLGALLLRRRSSLLIAHTGATVCAVLGLFPFVRLVEFSLDPVKGDHYVVLHDLIDDPLLIKRVRPGAWGHDANGFRNPRIPTHADIVAIGDSQTWGFNAARNETWPAVLSQLSGQTVYNMALGGYGPVEYRVLAVEALKQFSPGTLVIGLYFGNDLYDAYRSVYTRSAFPDLRDPQADPALFEDTVGPQASRFLDRTDVPYADRQQPTLSTHFTVAYRLLGLNLGEPRIREGLRITETVLAEINTQARAGHVRLVVLLIPTKETVYADLVGNNMPASYTHLLEMERTARSAITARLDAEQIDYFDVQPALSAALAAGIPVYLTTADGHPSPAGYRVMAAALHDYLSQQKSSSDLR